MDLSEEETKQLVVVMRKAQEFEMLEEKQLMRQPLEGQLFKYTNVMKGWQYRWFVLNPDLGKLEYFEKEDHKKFSRPRGCLTLVGAVVCPSDEDSQTFTVNAANGESYRLKAYDARERQHWVNRLRATAEYHAESLLNSSGFGKNGHVTSTTHSSSSPPMTSRPVENTTQARPPRTQTRTSPKPLTPRHHVPEPAAQTLTSSLKECRDQLESVRSNHQSVIAAIESLPSSGNFINTLDKDLLIFKATSTAAQSCLDKCLEILQHQASDYNGKDLGFEPLRTLLSDVLPSSSSSQLLDCSDSSVTSKNSPLHPCYTNPLPENSVINTDDEGSINHSDEVEDPQPYMDTELSGMEEHKNVILHLLSQLKLGMDLTKVVLPTFILEKRSLLEMFADCMAHPDLFLRIPDMPTPESRILAVVEWYLTSFHSGRQGSIAKKPYNPIIGESFHCSWSTDEVASTDPGSHLTADQRSSVPSGQLSAPTHGNVSQSVSSHNVSHHSELYYCAEQVSHHPPVSAFYFESPEKQLYMEASVWTRSKFMGMSIGVAMIGKVHLNLLSYGEEYEFSLPSAYARSILTVPWVELGDKVTLTCEKTGFSAAVIFHTKPFYGGRLHKVTAEVKNPSGELVCKVSGEWNGLLEFNYANGHSKIVDTSQLPITRKCVRPIESQGKMESRKLWRNVTESLQKGDVSGATEHKQQLEEIQRQGERRRRESRVPFPTKYFSRIGDEWVFKKRLRAGQKDPSL